MSSTLSPGGILARLEELKKWQQMQQERFSKHLSKENLSADVISPIPKRKPTQNLDFEGIVPLSDSDDGRTHQRKPPEEPKQSFTDLTDETPKVPKKPFLRKGTGLAKFRMTLEDTKPSSRPPSCILKSKSIKPIPKPNKSITAKKDVPNKTQSSQILSEPISSNTFGSKRKDVEGSFASAISFSPNKGDGKEQPLKSNEEIKQVPKLHNPKVNFSVKPKGLWTNVSSDAQKPNELSTVEEEESIISQINRIVSLNDEKTAGTTAITQIPQRKTPQFNISELEDENFLVEIEKFFKKQQNTNMDEFKTPVNVSHQPVPKMQPKLTVPESPRNEMNQSERDLKVFEALEQKATHSSFCSTNSSVAYLLSMQSTPRKSAVTSPEASPNSTIHSDDVKDNTEVNFEDENHWSSTEDESEVESNPETVRDRILIVVDAETMTDKTVLETTDEDLSRKLRSLEEEIHVFRTENSRLAKAKIELEKEMRELRKQKKEMEEDKQRMERFLEEEKRKLAKDKMVFDKYIKDLKNKPTKKEREEIAMLRNDLSAVKEELKLKESRHGAAQARLRTQIKQLEKDKETLTAEQEVLRTQNGRLMAQQKLGRPFTDTKVIHEINKKLTKLTQDKTILSKKAESVRNSSGFLSDKSTVSVAMSKKLRNSSNFSNATSKKNNSDLDDFENDEEEEDEDEEDVVDVDDVEERDFNDVNSNFSGAETQARSGKSLDTLPVVYARQISHPILQSGSSEKILDVEKFPGYDFVRGVKKNGNSDLENNRNLINFTDSVSTFQSGDTVEQDYEKMFSRRTISDQETTQNDYSLEENHKKERQEHFLKDGTQEIIYPNGNIKTISPDGNSIKMVYYNGDVKETDLSAGIIDYLYAESKIRHLTYSDGTEVLNFPDGKIEKRFKDGSYEITSPDGFVRNVDAEGAENATYPDGTRISVSSTGEKVVKLPNGQRIVHTKEHKRREYPDGTVNILYPDGLLETRYTNGRIRIKDAHGRCLMDSHGTHAE